MTAKLPMAVLPLASVAEHDTDVVPIGNVDPDGGPHGTATAPLTMSDADAA